MPDPARLVGQSFDKLVVLSRKGSNYAGHALWKCECECGKYRIATTGNLKSGAVKACTSCSRQRVKDSHHKTHGLSRSPTYRSWDGMIQRCTNIKYFRYADYGGRGIKICKRWFKFENFLADMGRRPKGKTLDRKNNDKNYEKLNCKWSTPKEQAQNRRNSKRSASRSVA